MPALTNQLNTFLAKKNHSHFINGQYQASTGGEQIAVVNPANEEVIGHIALGTKEDVHQAVTAAKKAFQYNSPWRKISPDDRGKILYRFAELITEHSETIAQLVTLENGKLLKDARSSDVGGAAKTFRYYACLLYTSPSPRDATLSRMPSSA